MAAAGCSLAGLFNVEHVCNWLAWKLCEALVHFTFCHMPTCEAVSPADLSSHADMLAPCVAGGCQPAHQRGNRGGSARVPAVRGGRLRCALRHRAGPRRPGCRLRLRQRQRLLDSKEQLGGLLGGLRLHPSCARHRQLRRPVRYCHAGAPLPLILHVTCIHLCSADPADHLWMLVTRSIRSCISSCKLYAPWEDMHHWSESYDCKCMVDMPQGNGVDVSFGHFRLGWMTAPCGRQPLRSYLKCRKG